MKQTDKTASAATKTERKDSVTGNEIALVKSSGKTLTAAEQQQLAQCETIIKQGLRAFLDVAAALLEVRDRELFRATHDTFQKYCAEKWGITSRHANRLVLAGEVVKNVTEDQLVSNIPAAVPQNEAQARELAALPKEKQVEVAREVSKKSANPTAKDFKAEAEKAGKVDEDEGDEPDEKPRVTSYTPPTPPVPNTSQPKSNADLEKLMELVDEAETLARKIAGCDDAVKILHDLSKAITRKLNGGSR
jgi:hypothetical protein